MGRGGGGSEGWCPRAAIRTAMPPAAAMATWLSVLHARFLKNSQAFFRTAALSGCVFMTAITACRGGVNTRDVVMYDENSNGMVLK